jgi:SAM-dependent methyltransferase
VYNSDFVGQKITPLSEFITGRKMSMLNKIRNLQRLVWPAIDYELLDLKRLGLLRGMVLNAGAGTRDVTHLIEGELINQDIRWPDDQRTHINIFSPIDKIPKPADTFDTILCIAVLEHVENPHEVVQEFFRVLKPSGYVIASVPFLQPEHKVPTDFQRYTLDGLTRLFAIHGFVIEEVRPLFSVYHTIHWIIYEWLTIKNSITYKMLRVLLLPPLVVLAKRSTLTSNKLASAFRILARKPALDV